MGVSSACESSLMPRRSSSVLTSNCRKASHACTRGWLRHRMTSSSLRRSMYVAVDQAGHSDHAIAAHCLFWYKLQLCVNSFTDPDDTCPRDANGALFDHTIGRIEAGDVGSTQQQIYGRGLLHGSVPS